MAAATFTLVTTLPRPHLLTTTFRAIRAFGGAALSVALLGDHGPAGAGIRDPRPEYAPGPD
ncbi:hypothetical protein [Streptomyces sp. NPDC017868]|uniref:hypothetical protein n=1 Tax=Streptomyces sp. NPDC017868 TaxID=3365014 RepID=UPI0037B598C9